jgi:hypothetical protein
MRMRADRMDEGELFMVTIQIEDQAAVQNSRVLVFLSPNGGGVFPLGLSV